MFERFTDRARRAVVLAQEEARLLNHNYIGTEHILLGLVHEERGVAARALTDLDVSLEAVRAQVKEIIGLGESPPGGHIPFTPRAKKVLELSLREALKLGHNYIGTEHILLGLLREGEGVAAQVLVKLGATQDRVRRQVTQLLSGYAGQVPTEVAAAGSMTVGPEGLAAMVAAGPGAYIYEEREAPELVRVVPLAREVHHGAGYRMVLVSLEIWSGWLDLRYALLADEPAAVPAGFDLAFDWRATDDQGTEYELAGAASGGGRLLRVHQLSFRPGLAEGARGLILTVSEHRADGPLAVVEIELAPEA